MPLLPLLFLLSSLLLPSLFVTGSAASNAVGKGDEAALVILMSRTVLLMTGPTELLGLSNIGVVVTSTEGASVNVAENVDGLKVSDEG